MLKLKRELNIDDVNLLFWILDFAESCVGGYADLSKLSKTDLGLIPEQKGEESAIIQFNFQSDSNSQ